METEYRITIGTDEREIPGTLIKYENRRLGTTSDKASDRKDLEIIEFSRGLGKILGSEEIEITIKSKYMNHK